MRTTALLLVSLVLVLTRDLCRADDVQTHIDAIDRDIQRMQFKTSETLFHQIRELISLRTFPIDLFPRELTSTSRKAEQAALKLASRCSSFLDKWQSQGIAKQLAEDLTNNRMMFARFQIDELKAQLRDIGSQYTDLSFAALRLFDLVHKEYSPRSYSEVLLHLYGTYLQIVVYSLCLLVPFLILLPVKRWISQQFLVGTISCAIVLGAGLCVGGHAGITWANARWGAPEPLVQVRSHLGVLDHYVFSAFGESLRHVNESIHTIDSYCEAMDVFNKTVLSGMVQLSQNVSAIASRSSTDPEFALQLVVQTRERIASQKTQLIRLASSRELTGNRKTDLNQLLNFMNYFEVFFAQMEMSIYSNLKTAYDMNKFFVEHMDITLQYIRDGDLVSCVSVLSELYRQQMAQLASLHNANRLVHDTNEAITQIRMESTRLQPELASEEMDFWLKKMASKGTAALAALPALAAFSLPVAAVLPVGVAGAAVALIGYNWQGAYDKAEKDTRAIIQELIRLDDVMHQTEKGLSEHERVLTMLMEDVGAVLQAVNQSQSRFSYIQIRRSFSPREIDFLSTGVTSTKEAVKVLNRRYESAMSTLFKRILARASSGHDQKLAEIGPSAFVPSDVDGRSDIAQDQKVLEEQDHRSHDVIQE